MKMKRACKHCERGCCSVNSVCVDAAVGPSDHSWQKKSRELKVLKTFSLEWLCSTPEEMPLEKTKTRLETTLTGSSDVTLMTTQLAIQPALAPPLEGAKTGPQRMQQQVFLIDIIRLHSDTLSGNKQQLSLRACAPLLPVRPHGSRHAHQRRRPSRPSGFVWVLQPDQGPPANRSI